MIFFFIIFVSYKALPATDSNDTQLPPNAKVSVLDEIEYDQLAKHCNPCTQREDAFGDFLAAMFLD